MVHSSIENVLEEKPPVGQRRRLLFMPESVSLAHLGRLLTLAQDLPSHLFDIAFACDRTLRGQVPLPFEWRSSSSYSPQEFRDRLDRGEALLDEALLHRQVNEDLALFHELRPAVVIGDFRPSLAISATLAGVHYINVVNAHWSPWAAHSNKAPGALNTWWCRPFGDRLGRLFVDALLPIGFRLQARPFNSVRRAYGLPPLPNDIRSVYTAGDTVAYTDLPELVPTPGAPDTHHHIGPVLWEPSVSLPSWWHNVPKDRPCVFVSVGSTGRWESLEQVIKVLRDLPVVTLVATSGRGHIDSVPNRVYVADYLPGLETCRRSDGVICNGGAGTVYQALSVGVPVLGMAANLDQMSVMAPVEKQGAGRCVPAGETSHVNWAKEISTLVSSPQARLNARRVAHQMARLPGREIFQNILSRCFEAVTIL